MRGMVGNAAAVVAIFAGMLGASSASAAEPGEGAGEARSYRLYRDTFILVDGKDVCLAKGSKAHHLKSGSWHFQAQPCAGSDLPEHFNTKDQTLDKATATVIADASTGVRFAWGTLIVPYKFQLSKDRELKGGATIGPYLGARFSWESMGIDVTPHIFVGAGSSSVLQKVNVWTRSKACSLCRTVPV